ncbi:hypothetical protein IAT40_001775 [Kwoniella sp. CBS 6097]
MSNRPNFLLIVADDLGFSDVGCFGGEIKTPNIDRLAREGARFSDYHTASACSPTRSMIMSGTDNHIAGVGVMYEHKQMDPERWNVSGHEGYLNHDVAALPEVLEDAGYWNVLSGKWHLGFRDEHLPSARGFHKSWALLPGCNNHFGWEPAYQNGEGGWPRLAGHQPPLYVEDGVKVQPEANTTNTSNGFYSSDFYADNLIKYLRSRTDEENTKPFFAFLPFSAPHWPLQCLPQDRDLYKGMYDNGPEALRKRRLERLIELDLVKADVVPHEVVAKTAEWDEMTPAQRRMSSRAMEVYAGMVTAMDRAIGRVIDHLDATGVLDNTVVIFQSDNGAEGAALEAAPTMGPRLLDAIDKYYNNSYENLGNHDSFIWYGPRWAQASTAPNRLMKAFVTEGGIRVPMVLRYPGFKSLQPGSISRAFTTCMDIMPTFLDLAGAKHPNPKPSYPREKQPYRGRNVFGLRGKSWMPYFESNPLDLDDSLGVHGERDAPVGWEQHGRASLRKGQWKIVFIPLGDATGTGQWQLYDLAADQGETIDLATCYPERLQEMIGLWNQYQAETGVIFGPPIQGPARPLLPDQIGGDPIEDQKIWMSLGLGRRYGEHIAAK